MLEFLYSYQVICVSIAVSILYLIWKCIPFCIRLHYLRSLPGPPITHWFFGNLKDLRPASKGVAFKRIWTKKHPRLCRYLFSPWNVQIQVCHPESIKYIYTLNGDYKGFPTGFLSNVTGKSTLLTSEGGKIWKDKRRLLSPLFHFEKLKSYIKCVNDCSPSLMGILEAHAENGDFFEISEYLYSYVFEILLQSTFSYKKNIQNSEEFAKLSEMYEFWRSYLPFRTSHPLLGFDFIYRWTQHCKKMRTVSEHIENFHKKILYERRDELTNSTTITKTDFVSVMLHARKSDDTPYTDIEIYQEVNLFLFAGLDTTSTALQWCIYTLARYTEEQEICRKEIQQIIGDKEVTDISKLTYLTMFIKETFRMHPPVSSINKKLLNETTIDGHKLPKGVEVNIGIYQVHYNEEFWPNPDKFDPQRFSKENQDSNNPYAFLPFSAGMRNCIGQHFSLQEIHIALVHIIRKFYIVLDEKHVVEPAFKLFIVPKNGVKVKLVKVDSEI